jgi:acyl-CoA synthetase (AMP-forming)/AMP-acid ligase II
MIHAHSLGRAARYYGERTALASGTARPTFRELHDRVGGIAAALVGHGFQAGDRLAMLLPNEYDYLELVYACAWLGVTAVPINVRLSETEINHVIADASPRGLIRHSSLPVPTVKLSWQRVLDQEPLEVKSDGHPEPIYDPEAILALIYTSGTTGHPKGVVATHANILANVEHLNYWMPYRELGVHLHAAPVFHIMDFPFMFAALAFGICQVVIPKFSPQSFCETVERERVSQSVLVPTMINMLTQFDKLESYDLTSLETLAYGGSPMAPELIHRIRAVLPKLKLLQGYGLSETGFLSGLQDREHTEDRLMSCGRTCPGIDLRVMDDSGKELEAGSHGELVARGANVMRGYWNNPEETKQTFRDGFFRTGDFGYRDADGYFYILDRLKDMIVTGGENVYSIEVERALFQHPAVREAAVIGIPNEQWGESVHAVIVTKDGATVTPEELTAHCRQHIGGYKAPRSYEFRSEPLPVTSVGKVRKNVLRDPWWAGRERKI